MLDEDRFFDVQVTYAKASPDDVCIVVTATNHGPDPAPLHLLPQVWFRNTWSWGRDKRQGTLTQLLAPTLTATGLEAVEAEHGYLGRYVLAAEGSPAVLFCDNETNAVALFGAARNESRYPKDGIDRRVVHGDQAAVNPSNAGTKAAFWYRLDAVAPGETVTVRLRLRRDDPDDDTVRPRASTRSWPTRQTRGRRVLRHGHPPRPVRRRPARRPPRLRRAAVDQAAVPVRRRPVAGRRPRLPGARRRGPRGAGATPAGGTWRSPTSSRCPTSGSTRGSPPGTSPSTRIPLAHVDPAFAKEQLVLMCREWAMHPNGQLPAYEWAFGDVNPPVHAWAAWHVYRIDGYRDQAFLIRVFTKLLLNFSWWVNRKDADGSNVFEGGFLGMDNIALFDRSAPLPPGYRLEQSDATSWMAFYCQQMFKIALELSRFDQAWDDIATKFLEHFLSIAEAMNAFGSHGVSLWHEEDGFFYDVLVAPDGTRAAAAGALDGRPAADPRRHRDARAGSPTECPDVTTRLRWLQRRRPGLVGPLQQPVGARGPRGCCSRWSTRSGWPASWSGCSTAASSCRRTASGRCRRRPGRCVARVAGRDASIEYEPGESRTGLFGGNSNWRGPVWFPVNVLLADKLRTLGRHYGDSFTIEIPTGSGNHVHAGRRRRPDRQQPDRAVPAGRRQASGRRRPDRGQPTHRCGASTRRSASSSTATPARAWAPRTRPAGRRWSPTCSTRGCHPTRADPG